MELIFDDTTGTWSEDSEVYGTIECATKEDYEYAKKAIKGYKELEAKHWDECRQIAHYDDDIKLLKLIIKDRLDYVEEYGKKILEGTYSDSYTENEGYWKALVDVLDIIEEVINRGA